MWRASRDGSVMHKRIAALLVTLCSLTTTASPALAQPAPTAPPPDAQADLAKKAEARRHFEKGVVLLRDNAFAAALAEFLQSRALYSTRSATYNAGLCLRKLQRYDEALDMFESLLREFPDLPPEDKVAAQREVVELRDLVGTIEVQGAEPGAAIVIDGRYRSDYPALEALRVPVGSHVVRVYKEGFEPFEARVDVAGAQTAQVMARLRTMAESGRLRVIEASGRPLTVVVDGVAVGKTPWEGLLTVGNHVVLLRGEGNLGTQPVMAPVRRDQTTPLSLVAEELNASLRVEPTPAGARVTLDATFVGRGIWEGRLRAGKHTVEVDAEGFLPVSRAVILAPKQREVLTATLERDPRAAQWKRPGRFLVEVGGAALLSPIFGGDVAAGCRDGCSTGPGVGGYGMVRGGYEMGAGLGFGLTVGYLTLERTTHDRATTLQPVGLGAARGTATDTLLLQGFLAGAWAGLSIGERVPLHMRIGGGFVLGAIADERTGAFAASDGSDYAVGPLGDRLGARFLYSAPEVRVGLRVGAHLELSAGVTGILLFALGPPTWDSARPINASADGIGTFKAETLVDPLTLIIAPGLGAQYDF